MKITKIQRLAGILNEKSFHNFDVSDIITDKYLKNYIEDDDSLLNYYITNNDLHNVSEKEVYASKDFQDFLKMQLEEKLTNAMENMYNAITNNGKITIYRAITVKDDWIEHLKTQGKHLGIFWSWHKEGADPIWADESKPTDVVITARVNEEYVDWKETFELNISSDEDEIRLFKNTPLEIISITIEDEEVDLELLANKTFVA